MGQSGAGEELHPWVPLPGTRGTAVGSPWIRGQMLKEDGDQGEEDRVPGWRLRGDGDQGAADRVSVDQETEAQGPLSPSLQG